MWEGLANWANTGVGSLLSPLDNAQQIDFNTYSDLFGDTASTSGYLDTLGVDSTTSALAGGVGNMGTGLASFASNINPMDILGYLQANKAYKLQKSAIEDQLKNSQMQRDLVYDQLSNKRNTQSSLAQGFGASTQPYQESLSAFSKYKPS